MVSLWFFYRHVIINGYKEKFSLQTHNHSHTLIHLDGIMDSYKFTIFTFLIYNNLENMSYLVAHPAVAVDVDVAVSVADVFAFAVVAAAAATAVVVAAADIISSAL